MKSRPIASIALVLFLGPVLAQPTEVKPVSTLREGASPRERFEHYCRTKAGEKIYRKVRDVEGVLLVKVRPQPTSKQLADAWWPGAAFAAESYGTEFIETFLGFEQPSRLPLTGESIPITATSRSYITTDRRPGSIAGYGYVDVPQAEGKLVLRYTGRWEEPWQQDKKWAKGYIKFYLDHAPATPPLARYAVTYEDHIESADRIDWIASSTVTVYDTKTKEVLGTLTRYALSGPPSRVSPTPWLAARTCPGHAVGANSATRKFVDQILVPKQSQEK